MDHERTTEKTTENNDFVQSTLLKIVNQCTNGSNLLYVYVKDKSKWQNLHLY